MELISKEAVTQVFKSNTIPRSMAKVIKEIGGLPIIESRSKGKWIDNTCSICGYTSLLNPYALVEENGHMKEELSQKFCPNCGADMRGKE